MIFSVGLALVFLSVVLARPPDNGRSMSWSGWMPGGGMTIFSSGDEQPWGMSPPPPIWRRDVPNLVPEDPQENQVSQDPPSGRDLPQTPRPHFRRDYDDEDDRRYSGSKANASFNAWFPIMLGMYPSDSDARSSKTEGEEGKGLAAVANSVNHGRSGSAASHAIIYAGFPTQARHRNTQEQQPSRY